MVDPQQRLDELPGKKKKPTPAATRVSIYNQQKELKNKKTTQRKIIYSS
jgi:hypothetical protein